MSREPASIRYKNPGAMWGSALAKKWGASPHAVTLNDGKGQGNNIAVFPTYVAGICAQLDLWRSSKNYKNKRFADAIAIWSGHNEVESYIRFVQARVPGMSRDTIMDDAFWRSPKGVAFLKAQAWHEAGKQYPAPDDDWLEAQRIVMGGEVPKPTPTPKPDPTPEPTPVIPPPPDVEPTPEPEPVTEEKPGLFKRIWHWVAGAVTSGMVGIYDWRILAAVIVFVLIAFGILLWLFGKNAIKGWISKQAS